MTDTKDQEEQMNNELDLDLSDINGAVSQVPISIVSLESPEVAAAVAEVEEQLTPEQIEEREWNACVSRLTTHCEKNEQWVVLQAGNGDYILKDALTCTSREFYDWIVQTYPPAGDPERYKHKPEDYADLELRKKALTRVCNLVKDLKWPVGSMSPRTN